MMLAKSLQSAAGNAAQPTYIEDVFSTYLYTGNGSTQTITNGIDLAGEGGLAWFMLRNTSGGGGLFDTVRGMDFRLVSSSTAAQSNVAGIVSATSTGLNLGTSTLLNGSGNTAVAWTFRKAPKFFDVVTWTGNDTSRAINHSLESVPGCIFVKRIDGAGSYSWIVWHRGYNSGNGYASLNATSAFSVDNGLFWGDGSTYTAPTSTNFTISGQPAINQSGVNYVAYLFAHDAGGFGDDGEQNVISCGSYTGNGSADGPEINLGYEPQWILVKSATLGGVGKNWKIYDSMRGWTAQPSSGGSGNTLFPNLSNDELANDGWAALQATGFKLLTTNDSVNGSGSTYIYIAIRRGPMKTPESGTEVFKPVFQTSGSTATSPSFPTGFVTDMLLRDTRAGGTSTYPAMIDRLRGSSPYLVTSSTATEGASTTWKFDSMTGVYRASSTATTDIIGWNFRRAPGFFDEVCYTGTGAVRTLNHNLGVAPELMIFKSRTGAAPWVTAALIDSVGYREMALESTWQGAQDTYSSTQNMSAQPTATQFFLGSQSQSNGSGDNFVAYLFASCPGVSKVGSYTGNGTSQTINCGFSTGARFVLIKRTDNDGNWTVWDSARGIISGNDPYLFLNTTDAEITSYDLVDPDSSGFIVNGVTYNGSGYRYIYLAIA